MFESSPRSSKWVKGIVGSFCPLLFSSGRIIFKEHMEMTEQALPLTTFYSGWDGFRQSLVNVVAPLTPEQLALPTAAHHWSIGMVVLHILANRVWWFHKWMGAGNPELAPIADWGWGEEGHEIGTA